MDPPARPVMTVLAMAGGSLGPQRKKVTRYMLYSITPLAGVETKFQLCYFVSYVKGASGVIRWEMVEVSGVLAVCWLLLATQ